MTTRAPIAPEEALAWWRGALLRPEKSREGIPDEPRCGWFKRKLAKGGVFVPARIWLEQEIGEDGELLDDPKLLCEVNGQPAEPDDQWSYLAGNPISEAEFKYLTARGEWAERYAPRDFAANPREPIDHLLTAIQF